MADTRETHRRHTIDTLETHGRHIANRHMALKRKTHGRHKADTYGRHTAVLDSRPKENDLLVPKPNADKVQLS